MQGFERGWTSPADRVNSQRGTRWKLVGNAVTVGVSTWLAGRIASPGDGLLDGAPIAPGDRWPIAAFGSAGKAWRVDVSMWPIHCDHMHLAATVDLDAAPAISRRAAAGFLSRAERGSLRFADGFLDDVADHVRFMDQELAVA